MNAAADHWGLPVVLPAFDQQDRQVLGLSEVWGQFMDSLNQASSRYHGDLVAAVRVTGNSGQWRAQWRLEGQGLQQSDSVEGSDPYALADNLCGQWAQLLAKRYAVAPDSVNAAQSVELAIDQVNDLQGYAAVRRALGAMTPIREVLPVEITPRQLVLRVTFAGELKVLQDYVALDHRFAVSEPGDMANPPGHQGQSQQQGQADGQDQNADAGTQSRAQSSTKGQPGTQQGADGQPEEGPGGQSVAQNPDAGMGSTVPESAGSPNAGNESDSSFSRLYPRLYYHWQGEASTPAAQPAAGEGAGQ